MPAIYLPAIRKVMPKFRSLLPRGGTTAAPTPCGRRMRAGRTSSSAVGAGQSASALAKHSAAVCRWPWRACRHRPRLWLSWGFPACSPGACTSLPMHRKCSFCSAYHQPDTSFTAAPLERLPAVWDVFPSAWHTCSYDVMRVRLAQQSCTQEQSAGSQQAPVWLRQCVLADRAAQPLAAALSNAPCARPPRAVPGCSPGCSRRVRAPRRRRLGACRRSPAWLPRRIRRAGAPGARTAICPEAGTLSARCNHLKRVNGTRVGHCCLFGSVALPRSPHGAHDSALWELPERSARKCCTVGCACNHSVPQSRIHMHVKITDTTWGGHVHVLANFSLNHATIYCTLACGAQAR